MLEQRSQSLRKIRHGANLVVDHPHPDDDVADQLSFGAVAEAAIIRQLVDFADIVQNDAREQQVDVDIAIMGSQEFRDRAHGQHMLDKPSEEGVMNAFGGRRDFEAARDFGIVHEAFEKRAQRSASDASDDAPQLGEHFLRVARGCREEIGLIHRFERLLREFVNGQLQPSLMNLQQAADFQEIVAIEGVHHFGGVIPHSGVDIARAVAEGKR